MNNILSGFVGGGDIEGTKRRFTATDHHNPESNGNSQYRHNYEHELALHIGVIWQSLHFCSQTYYRD
jgi:hypothetical protein